MNKNKFKKKIFWIFIYSFIYLFISIFHLAKCNLAKRNLEKCNFPAQVLSWNIFIRESTFRCLVSLFPYRYILLGDVDSLLNCNLSDIYVFTKWASYVSSWIRLYWPSLQREVGKLEKHSEKKRTRKFSAIICMFECHCFILSKAVQ